MDLLVDEYYRKSYKRIQRGGLQGWGNSLVDRWVEKFGVKGESSHKYLEIGASSGEHFRYFRRPVQSGNYKAVDLAPGISNPELFKELSELGLVEFITGNAEALPFENDSFDRSISLCVLAHVSDPEKVFSELKRVTKPGGYVIVGMPCDPGLLNRLIKQILTYRSMRLAGIQNPQLIYAREHKNGVGNLVTLAKHVFQEDDLNVHYMPFRIRSWNLNLAVILEVKVK